MASLGRTAYNITKVMGKTPNTDVLRGIEVDSSSLERTNREFKKLHARRRKDPINIASFREEYPVNGIMVGLPLSLKELIC